VICQRIDSESPLNLIPFSQPDAINVVDPRTHVYLTQLLIGERA